MANLETPLPIQFKKMYGKPINPDSVWMTLEEAKEYAEGPLGAPGEILSVKGENGDYDIYVISEDKGLVKNEVGLAPDEIAEIKEALTWQELT